ncbi:protein of unknown function [Streptomyces sp. KY75]|nr:protein of unknown function [Streptomyces sp. KY75]
MLQANENGLAEVKERKSLRRLRVKPVPPPFRLRFGAARAGCRAARGLGGRPEFARVLPHGTQPPRPSAGPRGHP